MLYNKFIVLSIELFPVQLYNKYQGDKMKYEVTTLNTKKAFSSALKELMEKKPFSKISISEIVKECGVNRNTFYYHFKDIQDLLKWTLEQEAVEVVKSFDLILDSNEAILFVLDYVEKNKHILNCAYDSIGRDELKRFFYNDFNWVIMKLIEQIEKMLGVKTDDSYKQFLCDFYTEALAGSLVNILKTHRSFDKEKLTEYLTRTLKSALTATIRDNKI